MTVKFQHTAARRRLEKPTRLKDVLRGFNTQPPEGGCSQNKAHRDSHRVSTHSRPKAAGRATYQLSSGACFNTQPPEGG